MADILFTKAKKFGQIIFVIIIIALIVVKFADRDQKVPPQAYGCYKSENSPDIVVSSGNVFVDQDGIGEIASSYRIDNVGPAIMTSKPLLLRPATGGRYRFFEDRAGRYMRLLPEPPKALEVTAADGMVISYGRVECGGAQEGKQDKGGST